MNISEEIDHALEFIRRIEAMTSNPHWTSERRWKIGEAARKASTHLTKIKHECRTTPTSFPCPVCAATISYDGESPSASEPPIGSISTLAAGTE